MLSLSVVVPGYNEKPNLARTVLAADAVLQNQFTGRLEWILVDDGSTDGTWSAIESLADSLPNVVPLQHSKNRGLGAAIWTGMKNVSSTWCTWLPADGQIDPQAIGDMVRLAHEADIVLLMREEAKRAWWRRCLTLGLYGLLRIMFGFDPYGYSGVYMIRQPILRNVQLHSTTGLQNYVVAMHCQRNGYHIRQTHTITQPRMSGQSKVTNLQTMYKTFLDVIKLRFVA